MSTKLTVFRGVLRVSRRRFRADRVISCSWRPDLVSEVRDETSLEFRGVKKRVKRLGVMGGGRFGFREQAVAEDAGGGDEQSSGVGSWRSRLRGAHGEDIFLFSSIYVQAAPINCQMNTREQWKNGIEIQDKCS